MKCLQDGFVCQDPKHCGFPRLHNLKPGQQKKRDEAIAKWQSEREKLTEKHQEEVKKVEAQKDADKQFLQSFRTFLLENRPSFAWEHPTMQAEAYKVGRIVLKMVRIT